MQKHKHWREPSGTPEACSLPGKDKTNQQARKHNLSDLVTAEQSFPLETLFSSWQHVPAQHALFTLSLRQKRSAEQNCSKVETCRRSRLPRMTGFRPDNDCNNVDTAAALPLSLQSFCQHQLSIRRTCDHRCVSTCALYPSSPHITSKKLGGMIGIPQGYTRPACGSKDTVLQWFLSCL